MSPPDNIKSLHQLAQDLSNPIEREKFSALGGQPYILLNLDDNNRALTTASTDILKTRLPDIPCPVLGIKAEHSDTPGEEFLPLMDVLLNTEQEAQPLIKNIKKHPISAMTLVQLTRHNEHASITDGLLAESLAYATLQGGQEFRHFLDEWTEKNQGKPAVKTNPEAAVLVQRSNSILQLRFNRPELRNAFTVELRDALVEGLELLASDPTITLAIIDGAGSCFCTGGDLTEFGTFPDTASAHAIRSTRNAGRLISEQAQRIEFHVHRACIGSGIELPAFAHKIVATEDTYFQLPEITLGLVPGAGGTVSITRRIGRQRTNFLALSAKRINSATALQWGLIDEVCE